MSNELRGQRKIEVLMKLMKKYLILAALAVTLMLAVGLLGLTASASADVFDVNGDGQVDISDVTSLLNGLAGVGGRAADVNGDGQVDISDVTALLNELASGADEPKYSEGLSFRLNDDGVSYSVSAGSCRDAVVVIPPVYDGKPVTGISKFGFMIRNMVGVVIPETIEYIGEWAFDECYQIIEVVNNSSLPITVGSYDHGCVAYTALEVHPGTSRLDFSGDFLFYTTEDGSRVLLAYLGGEGNFDLPENYKGGNYKIKKTAFTTHRGSTSLVIPAAVTEIGEGAFSGWSGSLESITVESGNQRYKAVGNCLIDTQTNELVLGCASSVIPGDGSVTAIGSGAFSLCRGLGDLVIPEGVTRIGDVAFQLAGGMTSLYLPDSLVGIGQFAFTSCHDLLTVRLGRNLTTVDETAFDSCDNLAEVINDSGMQIEIGTGDCGMVAYCAYAVHTGESKLAVLGDYLIYAESGNYAIVRYFGSETELILPTNLNGERYNIAPYAFYQSEITSIVALGVKKICAHAFYWCGELDWIELGKDLRHIGEDAFRFSALTTIFYIGSAEEWAQVSVEDQHYRYDDPVVYYDCIPSVPVI